MIIPRSSNPNLEATYPSRNTEQPLVERLEQLEQLRLLTLVTSSSQAARDQQLLSCYVARLGEPA